MHILKTNFNGSPNVGLFAYCNDSFCLIGKEIQHNIIKDIHEALKVPVHQVTICGTSLLGVFVAGNSKTILVPEIAFDSELAELKKLGIHYEIIKSKSTALGNNIICNDNGAVVSVDFTDAEVKNIGKALGVPVVKGKIDNLDTVGSLAVLNKHSCLVHRDIAVSEKKLLEKSLGIECVPTTVNMGSPYIHSGVLCNSKGMIIGDLSGGPEIVEAEEAFGLIDSGKD